MEQAYNFKENILCFQLDNQYIIAQLFKGKHKNRMHILYSTENFLDETEIFKLTKSWAADRGISFLWHISNVQNIRNNYLAVPTSAFKSSAAFSPFLNIILKFSLNLSMSKSRKVPPASK